MSEQVARMLKKVWQGVRRVGVFFLSRTSVLQRLLRTVIFSLLGIAYAGWWGRVLSAVLFFVSLVVNAVWSWLHPLVVLRDCQDMMNSGKDAIKPEVFVDEDIECYEPTEWDRVFVFLLETLLCTDIFFTFAVCFIDAVLLIEFLSPMVRLAILAASFLLAFATSFFRYSGLKQEYESVHWWEAFFKKFWGNREYAKKLKNIYKEVYGATLQLFLQKVSSIPLFVLGSCALFLLGAGFAWVLFPFQPVFSSFWYVLLLVEGCLLLPWGAMLAVGHIWHASLDDKVDALLGWMERYGAIVSGVMMGVVMAVCYQQQFHMIIALFLGDILQLSAQMQLFSQVFLLLSCILGVVDGYCEYQRWYRPLDISRMLVEAGLKGAPVMKKNLKVHLMQPYNKQFSQDPPGQEGSVSPVGGQSSPL